MLTHYHTAHTAFTFAKTNKVNQMLFDGLTVLQHRGQDAAGMVTAERRRLHLRKDNGLVKDVFQTHHMMELRGNVGIGHVRYPTAGSSSCAEAQPLYTNFPYGICMAHNGNLTNTDELTRVIRDQVGVSLSINQSYSIVVPVVLSLERYQHIMLPSYRDMSIQTRIQNFCSTFSQKP